MFNFFFFFYRLTLPSRQSVRLLHEHEKNYVTIQFQRIQLYNIKYTGVGSIITIIFGVRCFSYIFLLRIRWKNSRPCARARARPTKHCFIFILFFILLLPRTFSISLKRLPLARREGPMRVVIVITIVPTHTHTNTRIYTGIYYCVQYPS